MKKIFIPLISILSIVCLTACTETNTSSENSITLESVSDSFDNTSLTSEVISSEEISSEDPLIGLEPEVKTYYSEVDFDQDAENLKTILAVLINDHTDCEYTGLKTTYIDSDYDSEGNVYDIYSSSKFKSDDFNTGTSPSGEGQDWNREHTVPQSWFNKESPYRNDAFHVFPSDSYVNSKRGSLQYGEVANPSIASYTSTNGCIIGNNEAGSLIFEVCDEYKGDIARAYFYMATCYQDVCGNWGNSFSNTDYTKFTSYTLDLMTKWNREDPVSQRDIDRNNGIFKHQHNRNPYIDFADLGEEIFG